MRRRYAFSSKRSTMASWRPTRQTGVLTLATPEDSPASASVTFEFVALEFGPDARAMVGRPWQLARYTAPDGTLQDVLPEAVFQFRLEPDSSRAEAFDLCVDQNGSYEFDDDGFVVIRLDGPVDGEFCAPDNPEARRQVREARMILDGDGPSGTPLMYVVEGDRLTLSVEGGRGIGRLMFVGVDELMQQR